MKKAVELNPKQKVLLLALMGLAVLVTLLFPDAFASLERAALNRHIRSAAPAQNHEKIILVAGTDKTLETLRNWPWPSSVYAELVDGALSGAKTIVLCSDFMPTDAVVYDFKLASAMERHGNVVLRGVYLPESDSFLQPRQVLSRNAGAVGYYEKISDRDGVVRRYKAVLGDGSGEARLSPAHAALSRSGYDLQLDSSTRTLRINSPDGSPLHEIRLDEDNAYWIPDAGQDGYEVYEMIDVLEGRVPGRVFEGALVFVDASVSAENDRIPTPEGEVYTAVVEANAAGTVLAGFRPDPVSRGLLALITAILCAVCVAAALLTPAVVSLLAPALLSVSLFGASHRLFVGGALYLPVAPVLFWCWAAYLAATFLRFRAMSTIVDHTILPLQQTFAADGDELAGSKERLVRHLLSLRGLIESAGLSLLEPLITEDHEFVREHGDRLPDVRQGREGAVVVPSPRREKPRYRLLIPHPKTDPEEPEEYTLLGADRFKSPYAVQSIVSLIRNAALYYKALEYGEEKHRLSFNIVKCMVAAMDAKDPVTAGHSQRVAGVALQIGEAMGFSDRELEELELAAIVHDIGKIGIQDHILNKRGVFSTPEFMEMKTHPLKGISIMSPSGLSDKASDAILNHHERPDGRGYPGGKGREEIGLFAKIIKISDVYDALLGERQYKKAWPLEKVCDLLYRGRGSEFDPEITDLFLERIRPEGWSPPDASDSRPQASSGEHEGYLRYGVGALERMSGRLNEPWRSGVLKDKTAPAGPHDFLGLEWGEPFFETGFMLNRPYLLQYDPDRERYDFALRLEGGLDGAAVYSFLRGYLTSGALFLSRERETAAELTAAFGEPVLAGEHGALWDGGKIFLLLRKEVGGYDHAVALITKYEFSEEDTH